jgi:hypothetical protein
MVIVKAYSSHFSYCVDVWRYKEDTVELLDEYEISHTNYRAVEKIREYIKLVSNKFGMIKIKDDTGIW